MITLNDEFINNVGRDLALNIRYIDNIQLELENLENVIGSEFYGPARQAMLDCIKELKKILGEKVLDMNLNFGEELQAIMCQFQDVDEEIAAKMNW